jgi:hypothetical protein
MQPKNIPFINTPDGLIVMLDCKPCTISSQDSRFELFYNALLEGASEKELISLRDVASQKLREALVQTQDLEMMDGIFTFKGQPLPANMGLRLQEMLNSGYSLKPISKFMTRLSQHAAPILIPDICQFLVDSSLPLDADGNITAYAVAAEDYTDPETRLHDLRIGKTCEIPSSSFYDDLEPPTGLRFYTFIQLPSCMMTGQRAMIVQIDPSSITCVPKSSSSRSGVVPNNLTSRYLVLKEDINYWTEKQNLLTNLVVELSMNSM